MNEYLPEEIKEQLPEELEPAHNRGFYICPLCGSGNGKHRTGALKVYEGVRWYCHACGQGGDILDLVQKRDGLSQEEARSRLIERYGRTSDTRKPHRTHKTQGTEKTRKPDAAAADYIRKCAEALPGSAGETYLKDRGFTTDTMKRYALGYDAVKNIIVIPYPGTDYYITRTISGDRKIRKPTGITEPIFNEPALSSGIVMITEGQLDALSLLQAGAPAAVAIGGAGANKLKEEGPVPEIAVIVADNDAPGEKIAADITENMQEKGTFCMTVTPPDGFKDSNDVLKAGKGLLQAFVQTWVKDATTARKVEIQAQKDAYQEENAAGLIQTFWEDTATYTPPIPTGYPALDAKLGGGLYEGLYVLGAVSSLGKTTFALQMADQIAESGRDVIIFSLEMSRAELVAKSLSRLSLQLSDNKPNNAKTDRSITDPLQRRLMTEEQKDLLFNKVTPVYSRIGAHLWINEGLGTIGTEQIGSTIEHHVQMTGAAPVVFVDYLQIIAASDPRMSDKQITDKNVFELKRLSRAYKIPIITISSFNRDNYAQRVSMSSFKESGGIEYSSDVLIGLQPQGVSFASDKGKMATNISLVDACKNSDKRNVELLILKNRHGRVLTQVGIKYTYYAMFNCFQEEGTEVLRTVSEFRQQRMGDDVPWGNDFTNLGIEDAPSATDPEEQKADPAPPEEEPKKEYVKDSAGNTRRRRRPTPKKDEDSGIEWYTPEN